MYRFPAYILIKVINDNQLICIKISIISFQQSSIDESYNDSFTKLFFLLNC